MVPSAAPLSMPDDSPVPLPTTDMGSPGMFVGTPTPRTVPGEAPAPVPNSAKAAPISMIASNEPTPIFVIPTMTREATRIPATIERRPSATASLSPGKTDAAGKQLASGASTCAVGFAGVMLVLFSNLASL
ncbi:hypothetical protein SeLEV6574_g08149 [Synchytrium endobioticum]|nr:hypothetical protein SeLEV6574_g08149 [Synchytrium endobioticum]